MHALAIIFLASSEISKFSSYFWQKLISKFPKSLWQHLQKLISKFPESLWHHLHWKNANHSKVVVAVFASIMKSLNLMSVKGCCTKSHCNHFLLHSIRREAVLFLKCQFLLVTATDQTKNVYTQKKPDNLQD